MNPNIYAPTFLRVCGKTKKGVTWRAPVGCFILLQTQGTDILLQVSTAVLTNVEVVYLSEANFKHSLSKATTIRESKTLSLTIPRKLSFWKL